jgi:hypothetical protein
MKESVSYKLTQTGIRFGARNNLVCSRIPTVDPAHHLLPKRRDARQDKNSRVNKEKRLVRYLSNYGAGIGSDD